MQDFKAGMRVRLVEAVENFPTILAPAGEEGTVTDTDGEFVYVRLDRHFPELDEWDNVLQVDLAFFDDALTAIAS